MQVHRTSTKTSGKGTRANIEPLDTLGKFEASVNLAGKDIPAEFTVIFNEGRPIIGRKTAMEMDILRLGPQVNAHPKRVPFNLREKVESKLHVLEQLEIIEKIKGPTPWVSPIVVVPKPYAEIRLCIDMRKANEAIMRERHPIPIVDEILQDMTQSSVFSKLDLKWGYHELELSEELLDITTFSSHAGLYRYKRLMLGITSAPEIYQNAIQHALQGCEGVCSICDDTILHAKDDQQHDERIEKLLERLQQRGLTLNRKKCKFKMPQQELMGYLFSTHGIGPRQSKVQAVVNAREPGSVAKNIAEALSCLTQEVSNESKNVAEEYIRYFAENAAPRTIPIQDVEKVSAEDEEIALLRNDGLDWRKELQKLLLGYRRTPHTTTGVSPAELLFGREIPSKLPGVEELHSASNDCKILDRDRERKKKGKDYADNLRGACESNLKEGDKVLLPKPKSDKLSPSFEATPCEVVNKEGGHVEIKSPASVHYKRNVTHMQNYEEENSQETAGQ
ncbi:Uncharacterized protein K02A2.6 [Stylophora pistillata]|uniref:Uncharacterized protein K02A2.6 n=1 Tax=Stylophora pistillata TaxID=50429 RepID=A0A2B4RK21_STYPI|nr:Uncharacterized protein K02A2.6 [Stylophora pistillata]